LLAEPDHLPPIDFSDEAIEEWLGQTWRACMSSLRPDEAHESVRRMFDTLGSATSLIYTTEPEERAPEEYTAEVDAYIEACRGRIPSVLREAAGERLTPTQFVLNNDTDENYPEVEVRLHIEGAVEAVSDRRRPANVGRLPSRPRPYGPRQVSRFGTPYAGLTGIINSPASFGAWVSPARTGSTGPSVRIENGGSVTLTFSPVDIRPWQRNVPLATAVLLAHMPPGATARGTWEATSTGVRGIAHGDLQVPITGQPWSVADALSEDQQEGVKHGGS
jgi:hypothetical protein